MLILILMSIILHDGGLLRKITGTGYGEQVNDMHTHWSEPKILILSKLSYIAILVDAKRSL